MIEPRHIHSIQACMAFLELAQVGAPVVWENGSEEKEGQTSVLADLKRLKCQLEEHALASSKIAELGQLIDMFEKKYKRDRRLLTEKDWREMIRIVSKVRIAFDLDVVKQTFTSRTERVRGIWKSLIGEMLIQRSKVETLPDIVRHDLVEASTCYEHDAPTAAVMVGLRATEGCLRSFYTHLTQKTPPKRWKELLDNLISVNVGELANLLPLYLRDRFECEFYGLLDYLREVRNSAEHPDATFNKEEAEQILLLCDEVLNLVTILSR